MPIQQSYMFSTCISRIKDIDLKNRLSSIKGTIIAAALDYGQAADANALYAIAANNTDLQLLVRLELLLLY
jgi:hypothetical protein